MLAGLQDAFVALVADEALRRHFRINPEQALEGFALDARARAAIMGIPVDALDRYARSLIAKRWAELARVVPLVQRVAPSLAERYRTWARSTPARVCAGVSEGLRAHGPMRAALSDPSEACYAADLWSFEVIGAASRGDGEPRTFKSRFAIQAIAADVQAGLLPIDPELEPTEIRCERARIRWRRV